MTTQRTSETQPYPKLTPEQEAFYAERRQLPPSYWVNKPLTPPSTTSTDNETSDSDKPPLNESTSEAFKTISQEWGKAGLDFIRTALMFTPPGNTPEELEMDAAFKQLAKEELEKEGRNSEAGQETLKQ